MGHSAEPVAVLFVQDTVSPTRDEWRWVLVACDEGEGGLLGDNLQGKKQQWACSPLFLILSALDKDASRPKKQI